MKEEDVSGPEAQQNRLLALLTKAESSRLSPNLELVLMSKDEILSQTGKRLNYAYFPTTAIMSLMYVMQDGAPAEIAMVGNEGVIGLPLYMGKGISAYRVVVKAPEKRIG